jgi:phosphatidate cytidylyltransferase
MTELQKRVATGVVGAAALISLVMMGGRVGIGFFTAVISLAMTYEFASIAFGLSDASEKRYALLSLAWVLLIGALVLGIDTELLAFGFLLLFGYFLFTAGRHADELPAHLRELMAAGFALLYLVFLPLFLPRIAAFPNGAHWVMTLLLINWAGDTGAYFGGKQWGKTKLYPLISPKKTREGAFVGLGAGLIVTIIYKVAVFRAMPWGAAVLGPFVVGAVAQIGDLCESLIKRGFDKKDSGSILPGHGGFLDRFDGVVFSLPVMYAFVRWYG